MRKNWEQLAITGFVLFVAGIVWNVRFSLLSMGAPAHAYDMDLILGGTVAGAGVLLTVLGLRMRDS